MMMSKIDKEGVVINLKEDQSISCIHCKEVILVVDGGDIQKMEVELSEDWKLLRCAHCKGLIGEARRIDQGPGERQGSFDVGDVTWH